MNSNSHSSNPSHKKKPSYFKTLPDNIAQSPTGIPRISNSPFPALDPTKSFKSVYERAGFDVYKGNAQEKNKIHDYKGIKPPHPGLRSQSTSQIISRKPTISDKRNVSEFFTSQHHSSNSSKEKIKPDLQIDSKLANNYKNIKTSGREFVPSPLASAHSIPRHQELVTESENKVAPASESRPVSEYTINPQQQPASVYSSALSLSQQLGGSEIVQTNKNIESNNNLSTTITHESTPISYQQSESSFNGLSRKSSPERIQLQDRQFNHSPKRNSKSSFQISQIESIPEESSVIHHEPEISEPSSDFNGAFEEADFEPIIPKRAPPPVLSPIPQQKSSFDEEDFNAIESNFIPEKPMIIRAPDISLDSDIENDITIGSGEFDSSLDSLAPKNQHFNFENTVSPELEHEPEFRQEEIIEQQEKQISKEVEIKPFNNYEKDFADDDYEDDDINDDFNEDFNFKDQTLPSALPVSNSIPIVKVNDEKLDLNNDQQFENNKFRSRNISVASSVYTNNLDFSPNKYNDPSSGTTTATNVSREAAYENMENQLQSVDLNKEGDFNEDYKKQESYNDYNEQEEENYTKPLNIQMHSIRQDSTECLVDETASVPATPLIQQSFNFSRSAKSEDQQRHQAKYPPGEGPCRKCGLEINTKPIYSKSGELSGQWHRACFTCTSCDLKFSKKINCFVLNDEPYCEYHFHVQNNSLCKICADGIVGECLVDDSNDRYHVDCLKCSNCSNPINNDYLSINNKIYCEPCAYVFTNSNNDLTSKIEKRRTRIGFI